MAFRSSHQPPEVGSQYEHNYKGVLYTMIVVKSDSEVGYMVNGVVFRSPTAAAKAIVGKDQFVNGRRFWHM